MSLATYTDRYTLELTIDPAGTPVADSFDTTVDIVAVIAPDIAVWMDESDPETAGDGSGGGRMYLAAGSLRFIPWHSATISVINAVGGETGDVYVEGWII